MPHPKKLRVTPWQIPQKNYPPRRAKNPTSGRSQDFLEPEMVVPIQLSDCGAPYVSKPIMILDMLQINIYIYIYLLPHIKYSIWHWYRHIYIYMYVCKYVCTYISLAADLMFEMRSISSIQAFRYGIRGNPIPARPTIQQKIKAITTRQQTKLVGGWPTLLKNISQLGWLFPINIWENKKCSKPPTRLW